LFNACITNQVAYKDFFKGSTVDCHYEEDEDESTILTITGEVNCELKVSEDGETEKKSGDCSSTVDQINIIMELQIKNNYKPKSGNMAELTNDITFEQQLTAKSKFSKVEDPDSEYDRKVGKIELVETQ